MGGEGRRFVLSYEKRQQYWEQCREYIDRECIYRVDDSHPPIPAKAPGKEYVWQVYSRRATFHPVFARRLGLLFWDHFLPVYEQAPFQVCACLPSGTPIGVAIMNVASLLGVRLNMFIARREPKTFGHHNWFEGRAIPKMPVLLVDDAAASAPFLKAASARVQQKLKLPLHRNYFTLLNKVGLLGKDAQHTENYLNNELISFFTMNNFCLTVERFKARYGETPKWTGIVQ